jgi:hypothetical protein
LIHRLRDCGFEVLSAAGYFNNLISFAYLRIWKKGVKGSIFDRTDEEK